MACNNGSPSSTQGSSTPSAADKAKEAVTAKLKDPSSAQFRNVQDKGSGLVCGEVNAKNGFGGYGGFEKFKVQSGAVVIGGDPVNFKWICD
jgi:hypothetical protein